MQIILQRNKVQVNLEPSSYAKILLIAQGLDLFFLLGSLLVPYHTYFNFVTEVYFCQIWRNNVSMAIQLGYLAI
jgi:hypothetical protein